MSITKMGVIGMATMGRNIAINIAKKGYKVYIYNRSKEKTNKIINQNLYKNIIPTYNLKEFIKSLSYPRIILIMIKSGNAIDKIIYELKNYLIIGDIIIDGGNTLYLDTIIREKYIYKIGINFIGAGISGGEEGALKGPSIMPGGNKISYKLISQLFKKVAAKINKNTCIKYIGPNGSGHYVKMVHNGIEYGDMQIIAESYLILKNILNLNNEELATIFKKWNKGDLNSYLIEITYYILRKRDEKTGKYLIDIILDIANQKGTGKWSSKNALDLCIPLPLITQSVFSRYFSYLKNERVNASKFLIAPPKKIIGNKISFIESVRRALYMSKITSYAQCFAQLKFASNKYFWNMNYEEISKIFSAGCIISAKLLKKISEAYNNMPNINNLLMAPYFQKLTSKFQSALREIVAFSVINGIPIPAFSSAINYYDSYRSKFLPANIIQAQRDYFGGHTYKRIDAIGNFHTNWV
ncbi:6-phosphogluconate dehydrogenase, decarboxylating [Candidatus Johnevansia muelleri]|uniref:6-phosphogluconate dehydrogenase, decarboxylating n=1 Tax=Candidatus Johnevansia muelleri TaxID=1495769 RepID=A0A078KIF3_9GAMM|nr:6-phosphogluconate dehydrogenase, decarboxylating [Candidatus Evansia muelleri]